MPVSSHPARTMHPMTGSSAFLMKENAQTCRRSIPVRLRRSSWNTARREGGGQFSNSARKLSATGLGSRPAPAGLKTARIALTSSSSAMAAGKTPTSTISRTGQTPPIWLAKRHKADTERVRIGKRASCPSLAASGHSAGELPASCRSSTRRPNASASRRPAQTDVVAPVLAAGKVKSQLLAARNIARRVSPPTSIDGRPTDCSADRTIRSAHLRAGLSFAAAAGSTWGGVLEPRLSLGS